MILSGEHLRAFPEIKKFVLCSTFNNDKHIVTEEILRRGFPEGEVDKIRSGRSSSWYILEYFEEDYNDY